MTFADYKKYTLNELLEAKENLNKEKYPDTLAVIEKEIQDRKEAGESFSFVERKQLWSSDIPIGLGIRIWWCFFWRTLITLLILSFLIGLLFNMFSSLFGFSKDVLNIINRLLSIIFTPVVGTFFIMQALARIYKGYRIDIVKIEES